MYYTICILEKYKFWFLLLVNIRAPIQRSVRRMQRCLHYFLKVHFLLLYIQYVLYMYVHICDDLTLKKCLYCTFLFYNLLSAKNVSHTKL